MRLKFLVFIIVLLAGFISACTKIEDDRPAMERIQMTGEYLDLLGKFNSVSREFSRAVKPLQEADTRMNTEMHQEYWNKYDAQRVKALDAMNKLKNFQYRFEPFKSVQPDFLKFVSRMEDYDRALEKMRASTRQWTPERKKECYAVLDPIYADILQQSKEIVQKIDVIYNRVFVVGEGRK